MKILSICTGAGLLDRAFLDEGFGNVAPMCEIDPRMRAMYTALNGEAPWFNRLEDAVRWCDCMRPDGIIGGPPCQSLSKMRAMRSPKFPDLSPLVLSLLEKCRPSWYLFENVAKIPIPGSKHVRLDAMHFGRPHQSRPRWFTHSTNLTPPDPVYEGTVDDLMAYSIVAGRIYGPKRGAVLQGYPDFARLPFPCVDLQLGLANAVHYGLARAWARRVREAFECTS